MKKVVALILVLVFAMALVACGGNSAPAPAPSTPAPSTPAPSTPAPSTPAPSTPAPTTPAEEPWADKPEVVLVLAGHDPDQSLPGIYVYEWADAVKQESRGRIEIEVHGGSTIAGATEVLDAAKSGIADISFGLPSFYPGQFPMTDALIMPFMPFKSSVQASEAFMDIWYNTNLLQSDPGWKGLHVLMLRANCDTPIITASKKLNSVSDMSGMRFRATIAPLQKWLAEFSAVGEGCPIGELFQNLQNGAFNGALTDWHAINSYRLYDNCAKFFADEVVQWNMYFFVMNEGSYNRLSAQNKAVIDKLSGEGAFAIMKDAWDNLTSETKKAVLAQPGNEIYNLPAAEAAALKAAAEKTNAAYIASLGDPGKQLWDKFSSHFPK